MLGVDLTLLTKSERRIFDRLMDGLIHSPEEIIESCFDSQYTVENLRPVISGMRNKIFNQGLLISFVVTGGRRASSKGYQMSRRIIADDR